MRTVLDVEGPVYRMLSRFTELIMISLIWAALSLPLVTAPVAAGWLCHAVRATRSGEPILRWRPTLGYLRSRMLLHLRMAAVQAGVIALVLVALLGPSPGGWYGQLVFAVGCLVGVMTALVAPWSVALLDRELCVRAAILAGYRRAVRRLSLALLSAMSLVAVPAAICYAPGWIRLVVLVVAPGLAAAVVTRLCDLAGSAAPETSTSTTSRTHHLRKALS